MVIHASSGIIPNNSNDKKKSMPLFIGQRDMNTSELQEIKNDKFLELTVPKNEFMDLNLINERKISEKQSLWSKIGNKQTVLKKKLSDLLEANN